MAPSEPTACFQAVSSRPLHPYPAPEEQRHRQLADSRDLYSFRVDPLDFRSQSEWLCLDLVTTSPSRPLLYQASSPSPSRYSSAPWPLAPHLDLSASYAFQQISASCLEPERSALPQIAPPLR